MYEVQSRLDNQLILRSNSHFSLWLQITKLDSNHQRPLQFRNVNISTIEDALKVFEILNSYTPKCKHRKGSRKRKYT